MASRADAKAATRERVAAMRAAQARAEKRRRLIIAGTAVGAVLVIVAALVIAKAAGVGSGGGTSTTTQSGTQQGGTPLAAPAVVKDVTSVPASVLDQVGVGGAQAAPKKINASALTEGGKPKFLYVGAEYCPYCAAERWAVVVALSRFGTWSNLGAAQSSTQDVFPGTQTLSFHGASFASPHLAFTGTETNTSQAQNGSYAPLDTVSAADQKVLDTYNKPPYVSTDGAIPFLDIGGRFVSQGASYSPDLLKGMSRAQIAAALSNPNDPVAKAVDGTANVITAAVCAATGNQPTAVCTSPGVVAAAKALGT